jgi:hypothetical protein
VRNDNPLQFIFTLLLYAFLIILLLGAIRWAWHWAVAQ